MRLRPFAAHLLVLLAALLTPFAQAEKAGPTLSTRPDQWAQPVDRHYNLYRVTPTLYRSRQPDAAAQPLLQQLGVHTVINFLKESDSKWLSDPSIAKVQIPLQVVHIDDADVIESLRAIQSAQNNGPVLIHCKHGLDRTGLVAAMYRIVVQGWSKQAALDEMEHGGYGDEDSLKRGIEYIDKVDVAALKSAIDSGACSTSVFALCSIKGWSQKVGVIN
jgi:protein tyrosine/serine phosphatase